MVLGVEHVDIAHPEKRPEVRICDEILLALSRTDQHPMVVRALLGERAQQRIVDLGMKAADISDARMGYAGQIGGLRCHASRRGQKCGHIRCIEQYVDRTTPFFCEFSRDPFRRS